MVILTVTQGDLQSLTNKRKCTRNCNPIYDLDKIHKIIHVGIAKISLSKSKNWFMYFIREYATSIYKLLFRK